MVKRLLLVTTLAAVLGAATAAGTAAAAPASADCVAQYVHDFMVLFPGFTIGDIQGRTVVVPGYPFVGQAHTLQPFGVLLQTQATAATNGCPFDLTPG